MAKNVLSLQLLRNSTIFPSKTDAIAGITGSSTQDGVIKLARYTEGTGSEAKTKTIFGIYHAFDNNSGYTIYDSYQEVIDAIKADITAISGASVSGVTEINAKLGSGVTSANTVTDQLKALSGDSSTAQSGDTSVEGAKRYADGKIDALDYTDTAATGNYVSAVNEANGIISVTREALPTVGAISSEGQAITAVSQSLGTVNASYGDITAAHVTVADANSAFTATNVEDVLAEIDAAYKAADTAIIGGASASADTLGELETLINNLEAGAATYTIRKDTESLPAEIKERYTLVETKNGQSTDKQVTIDIPKDSHIVSINYITDSGDTHYQNLQYNYIDASGNTQTTYVDMSALIIESEFGSGVTFSDGVAHGVVDPTSESFLTVGENGFKLTGVSGLVTNAIEGLDADVSGNTAHVTVNVVEENGVITAVNMAEDDIASADDLTTLSAKTVTEVVSSNNSITAALSAATDGTKHLDIITDASKIKMSGYTAVTSGVVSDSQTVVEAVAALEGAFIDNEQVVAAALNDLETRKAEKTALDAEIAARKAVDGQNGDTYVANAGAKYISGATSLNDADLKLDAAIANITTGFIEGVQVNGTDLPEANNKVNVQIIAGDTATDTANAINVATNKTTGAVTLTLGTLDCGTY